eukprot:1160141-Pelagomonas_calceolata.AAC.9
MHTARAAELTPLLTAMCCLLLQRLRDLGRLLAAPKIAKLLAARRKCEVNAGPHPFLTLSNPTGALAAGHDWLWRRIPTQLSKCVCWVCGTLKGHHAKSLPLMGRQNFKGGSCASAQGFAQGLLGSKARHLHISPI